MFFLLTAQVLHHFIRCVTEVLTVHDLVPMQYRRGLMAADIHRVFSRYAGIDHVPHRCAPEIMEDLVVAAKFRAPSF